ncbi:MAG: DUF2232 domain-containing protein [Spirochaetes bacterium]|nr:DUF2232 domain-containing protein [Spirochaetota bacterium]
MEHLLGFPLSLAFTLIPLYLYRSTYDRRLWLAAIVLLTAAFAALPARFRLEAFMPSGAAIYFLISGLWVVALNPMNAIFKLLNMPLPSRRELKAEIEKASDVESRVQKYLKLTDQLKRIWQKRDALLSGYNSALLLFFTILSAAISFSMALYEYFVTGNLKAMFDALQAQMAERMKAAGVEIFDFRPQLLGLAPTIIFVSSFFGTYLLSKFLRAFARLRFKQNLVQGNLSLFRLPDSWVWALLVVAGSYVVAIRTPAMQQAEFALKNAMLILFFLYMLQGIGIVSLFFEVRLLPSTWITFGVLLIGVWVPEFLLLLGALFAVIGLTEIWLSLRKRSLRVVNESDLG